MGRGWADIYLIKGVSGALVLTIRELRKLICQSRTKQQETSHGCVLYTALIGFDCILHSLSSWGYYILTHTWGFRRCISVVHSKTTILICYLLDYQQVHDNVNVSIILLGDKKEPTK